jgi:hypothetical protein
MKMSKNVKTNAVVAASNAAKANRPDDIALANRLGNYIAGTETNKRKAGCVLTMLLVNKVQGGELSRPVIYSAARATTRESKNAALMQIAKLAGLTIAAKKVTHW